MTHILKKYLPAALAAAAVLCIFAFLYSRQQQTEPISATAFKLNTVVTITLYDSRDEQILDEALALCDRYEKIFSRTLPDSELYRLNHGQLEDEDSVSRLSAPLAELISQSLSYCELSGGAFDITLAPVSSLWDFGSGEARIPDDGALADALALVDYRQVFLEDGCLRFGMEGMQLDLGAAAKGYIADRIKEYLISEGVESAVIDLGGNILCVGSRPDGSPFRVGLQKPFADRSETAGIVEISGKSVVSSGIYERCFTKDGRLYHHILDPQTGYPYENGLTSVTILSDSSADGDVLSTCCFALGLEKGMELIDSLPDIYAVFITDDGQLHFSSGFEAAFSVTLTDQN